MSDLESLREMFGSLLMQVCLSAFLLIACGVAVVKLAKATGGPLGELWRRSRGVFAALAMLALCMTLNADKTNEMMRAIHRFMMRGQPSLSVSEVEISYGYRVEGVATNSDPFAALPSNAVEYARWSMHGGFAADFALDLGDFVFPIGTNRISRFGVLSGGAVEPLPRGTFAAVYAAREYASLVPGVSRFWSADADDGAKVLRWDRVFANRDSTGEYTAEMRFFQNGDFTTRSNEVETAYRRVNPDDWDDDGIPNDEDVNPTVCDGDFFGPANVLPEGANTNAYCTVSLVATGPDALVAFAGDKPGNYPDPRFVAKSGVTNEVVILIGKTYAISSDWPFAVVGVSDPDTEVWQMRGATHQTYVRRPVTITSSGGNPFTMSVSPGNLGGVFEWNTNCCCPVVGSGLVFGFSCTNGCSCAGRQAWGAYLYGGYFLDVCGGECSCATPEPQGDIAASLDWPSVVDVARPGEVALPVSLSFTSPTPTNGVLSLLWASVEEVGVWRDAALSDEAGQQEEIGVTNCTSLTRTFYLKGLAPSPGHNNGIVGLQWKDDYGVRTLLSKNFTVVERTAEPITDELTFEVSPFAVVNPSCVNTNSDVYLSVLVLPPQFPDADIVWRCKSGSASFPEGNAGRNVKARVGADTTVFAVQVGDCPSPELELTVRVWPTE